MGRVACGKYAIRVEGELKVERKECLKKETEPTIHQREEE